MNITYLIGNGFDVNLGLHTKYTDYYDKYIEIINRFPIPPTKDSDISVIAQEKIRNFWDNIANSYENWADFEYAITQLFDGDEQAIKAILSHFTINFSQYLSDESNKMECTNQVVEDFKHLIINGCDYLQKYDQAIMKQFKIGNRAESFNISIINFNYTDSIEKILDKYKELHRNSLVLHTWTTNTNNKYQATLPNSVTHIHGSLGKDDHVIIGIDSTKQFKDEQIQNNKAIGAYCEKARINNDAGYSDRESKFVQLINTSTVIYTYGISFGITDVSRWKIIAGWLKKHDSHKLVVYYYATNFSSYRTAYIRDFLDKIDECKKEIILKLGLDLNEFERFKNQIFIIDSSDVMKSSFTEKQTVGS